MPETNPSSKGINLQTQAELTGDLPKKITFSLGTRAWSRLAQANSATKCRKIGGATERLVPPRGRCGCLPGEFNLPHNIHCDANGCVYVAGRENHRIQVFDGKGRFETQSTCVHRPSALCLTGGTCRLCFVDEIGPYLATNRGFPNLGPRISVLNNKGELLARLGREENAAGQEPGQFMSPHGIALDSQGNIYVGEVSIATWHSLYPDVPCPSNVRSLQKLVKLPTETG